MTVGVNRDGGDWYMLVILYPAMFTHNRSVSECSGDCSTSVHFNRSWTNGARSRFLLWTS